MIQKVLIANRGEIAVRIIQTCRILGISTVVAYSKCDKDTMAVFLADEAICIGDSSPSDSYINIPAILEAAKNTGCDSLHPGYGFLSENDEFESSYRLFEGNQVLCFNKKILSISNIFHSFIVLVYII